MAPSDCSTTSSGIIFWRSPWIRSKAEAEGISIKLWDFLFYASFGFVVTSSVSIAGVLLVFCYLIVPSVAAMLYADTIGQRLAIGWTMGTIVSALGVFLSLKLDLPTALRSCAHSALALIVMAAVRPLIQKKVPVDVHHVDHADHARPGFALGDERISHKEA